MTERNAAAAFAESLKLCDRHPSRQAAGLCEACGARMCRACSMEEHVCAASTAVPDRGRKAGGPWLRLVLLAVGLLLAGAAGWSIARWAGVAAPEPVESTRARRSAVEPTAMTTAR